MTSLKHRVAHHPAALWLYGRYLLAAAAQQRRQGRPYRALDRLCQGYRQIPQAGLRRQFRESIHMLTAENCGRGAGLRALRDNRFITDFAAAPGTTECREKLAARPLPDRIRLRQTKADDDPRRQGCLIVLKQPDPVSGERGVILLKYLYSFAELPALFDLQRLNERYQFVLEPSWTGYVEPAFWLYAGSDADVVIQCTQPSDAEFFQQLDVRFRTVPLGGGDWVDFELFAPQPGRPRDYDVAIVASWEPWKRHRVLFQALADLAPRRRLRVAMLGGGSGERRQTLEREMADLGVRDQIEIYERVPAAKVAEILGRSKCAVLLSKLEGTNKGIHEALFCDTPIVVYRHHVGLNMATVNDATGRLADDHELADVLDDVTSGRHKFTPRDWALAHTGFRRSTDLINATLREMALARGVPWTRDLVDKVNRPHAQYKSDADRVAFEPAYVALESFLRDRSA